MTWPVFSVTLPLPHFMKSAFYLILLYSGSSVFSFSWNLAQLRSKPSVTRPGNSRLFAPDRDAKVVGSSRMAQRKRQAALRPGTMVTGSAAPAAWGFGREDLHLRPVVRELAAAIKANHVYPGYGSCCSAAAQFAAHGDREAAAFVPTTEDQIEQTHKPSSIEATRRKHQRHSPCDLLSVRIRQAGAGMRPNDPMVPNESGRPQAHLRGYEAAMGKAERQICSQEGQKPSSNECRCQEEVVGVDEGAVGSEEKVESIVPVASARAARPSTHSRGI